MGPHDITEIINMSHEWKTVRCACGKSFVESTEDKAKASHARHFGLESARAALKGPR